jgi:hypothetical protein
MDGRGWALKKVAPTQRFFFQLIPDYQHKSVIFPNSLVYTFLKKELDELNSREKIEIKQLLNFE